MKMYKRLLSILLAGLLFFEAGMPTVYAKETETQQGIVAEQNVYAANVPMYTDLNAALDYLCEKMTALKEDVYLYLPVSTEGLVTKNVAKLNDMLLKRIETSSGMEGMILKIIEEYTMYRTTAEVETITDKWILIKYTGVNLNENYKNYIIKVKQTVEGLRLGSLSERDKVKKIYDYICQNVSPSFCANSEYEALFDGIGDCYGYSALFNDMCIAAGLSVLEVSACRVDEKTTTSNYITDYSWNAVKIGDYYYLVDCYEDDMLGDYDNFLKTYQDVYESRWSIPFFTTPEFYNTYQIAPYGNTAEKKAVTIPCVELFLNIGEEYTFPVYADGKKVSGKNAIKQWTSSNEKVAVISEDGRVRAVSVGLCVITAKGKNGETINIYVEVGEKVHPLRYKRYEEETVEKIIHERNTTRQQVGGIIPQWWNISPYESHQAYCYEYVLDDSILKYNREKMWYEVCAVGETWIELYVEGNSEKCSSMRVEVYDDVIEGMANDSEIFVENVTFPVDNLNLGVGDTYVIQADVFPFDATDKELTWYDQDGRYVKVEGKGTYAIITAVAEGDTLVAAISRDGTDAFDYEGKVSAICNIHVGPVGSGTDSNTGNGPDVNIGANGLAQASDGNWYKYVNGVIDTAFTGLYCDANVGWWLVRNGQVDFGYTGLWNDPNYGWWLIGGGAVCFDYTGLWNDPNYGWWLIGGGAVCFDYTGLWNDPNYGWWLIGGGAVCFDYTGLWNDPNCGWWLIGGGRVCFEYNNLWNDLNCGWWLVQGGTISFGYTGLYYDSNVGWWYVENGMIQFGYTGVVYYDGLPYNVVNGQLI